MDVIEAIKTRRSVREFKNENITNETIEEIIDAARWAPSGLNNQAWRFIVVSSQETKNKLSELTKYGKIILSSPVLIVVFLDKNNMYDYTKDVLSIGSCIQNMLLTIHSMEFGAVWLGEILKNKEKVNSILKTPESYELMAVIALGKPVEKIRNSNRKPISELMYYI